MRPGGGPASSNGLRPCPLPSAMFQIVYVSAAVEPMSEEDLQFLLRQSRDNNDALGLTGMLLYKKQRFMQVLEGERDAVETIYHDHICEDDRHEGLVQLMGRTVEERAFPDWSMGFRTEGGLEPLDQRTFTPFIDPDFTPSYFTDNLSVAHQMLLDFRSSPLAAPDEDDGASGKRFEARQQAIDRAQERLDEAQRRLDERRDDDAGRPEGKQQAGE